MGTTVLKMLGFVSTAQREGVDGVPAMQIFIQQTDGTTAIDVPSSATVGALYDIAEADGLPIPLSFAGERLNDLDAQLADLGIGAETVLNVVSPVIFDGRQMEYFDLSVDGKCATLMRRHVAGICFSPRTKVGQVSEMKVKVTQPHSRTWARAQPGGFSASDGSYSNDGNYNTFHDDASYFSLSPNDVSEVTITIDAKEPDAIMIIYDETSSDRDPVVVEVRSHHYDIAEVIHGHVYNWTAESEVQMCIRVGQEVQIQIVSFGIVKQLG